MATHEAGGGFMLQLPSPPPSSVGSTITGPLPRPRVHPLKSGSSKESTFINTVDARITAITRMIANKDVSGSNDVHTQPGAHGYTSFKQAVGDISRVTDLIWVSGTPTLQIPYLIRLATLVLQHIPSFPPAPKSMFMIINKLDYAFASLIQGHDLDTGEPLPGLGTARSVNATERVRIKSLIERTRVVVVQIMNATEFDVDDGDVDNQVMQDDDGEGMSLDLDHMDNDDEMEIARVYDRTLVELGDTIDGPNIGIPRE